MCSRLSQENKGFRVIPVPFTYKQNEIKGSKETGKQGTSTERQTEPYEHWIFQRSEMFLPTFLFSNVVSLEESARSNRNKF